MNGPLGLLYGGLLGAPQRMAGPGMMPQSAQPAAPMPGRFPPAPQGGGIFPPAPSQPSGGGGMFGGLQDMQQNNPEALMMLGAGLYNGNIGQGLAAAAPLMAAGKKKNETKQWLMDKGLSAKDAGMVAENPAFMKEFMTGGGDEFTKRAEAAKQYGLTEGTPDYQDFVLTGKMPEARGGSAEMSLNTIPGVDEDGNAVLIQVDKAGVAHKTAMPDGVRISKPPMIKDTGTEFQVIDPITREIVQSIPKNVAGAAAQAELGKNQGGAAFDLPRVEQNAAQTLDVLERMKTHPGREGSTGYIQGALPSRTSDQIDFQSLVDQTQGQAFLQAFQMLKGAGQITEIEGAKATQAISRLGNQRLSDADYLKAISDLEEVINAGTARARVQAASGGVPAAPGTLPPPAGGAAAGGAETWVRGPDGKLVRQ